MDRRKSWKCRWLGHDRGAEFPGMPCWVGLYFYYDLMYRSCTRCGSIEVVSSKRCRRSRSRADYDLEEAMDTVERVRNQGKEKSHEGES